MRAMHPATVHDVQRAVSAHSLTVEKLQHRARVSHVLPFRKLVAARSEIVQQASVQRFQFPRAL